MPVTEQEIRRLGDYVGATPAPADFDAFWSKRMAEADQVPLDFAVTPSEIPPFHTCEYLDLWFRGMGGAQLYAKYVKPRAARPVPLVLQFHGYPGASRSWLEQSSFAGMGCALLAMDCNEGQGYCIAPPMDKDSLFRWLQQRADRREGIALHSGLDGA